MSKRTLLYSGIMGGKTTFVGGLYSHAEKQDDIVVSYHTQIGREVWEDHVISPLFEQHQYPHQTTEPYLVEFRLESDSFVHTPIKVFDFPGENIGGYLHKPWEQQQNEETVRQQYEELNIGEGRNQALRLEDWNTLRLEDWNTILAHQYFQSENLIFLLNLYKLLMTDQSVPSYDADDLRKVAKDKNVAVVATGTDILNHKPDEDVVSNGGILDYIWNSGSPVDSELLDTINDVTPPSQVTNILNTVRMEDDISFFGVAVPSREPGEEDRPIATEDGNIETRGFGNVIRWVR
jgi:hypothetical protein